MRIYIWIKILPLLFVSCNSIINTAYDDTTARYNAYFLANESIEEIENELLEKKILTKSSSLLSDKLSNEIFNVLNSPEKYQAKDITNLLK